MTAARFYIADTFTDSLARLNNDERKAVKLTAFDLQLDAAKPGMSFHKLDRARDKNFWSVRVTRDVRIIVHKISTSIVLCYVDHHDKAYEWAERRKLVAHPTTGAAQLITLPVPQAMEGIYHGKTTHVFAKRADLPSLKDGKTTPLLASMAKPPALKEISFTHPDAQRHFHMIANAEELQRALDFTLTDMFSPRSTTAPELADMASPRAEIDLTPVRVFWPEQLANRPRPPIFGKRKG